MALASESAPATSGEGGGPEEAAPLEAPLVVHMANEDSRATADGGGQQTHLGQWRGEPFVPAPEAAGQVAAKEDVEDLWEQVSGRPAMRTAIWAPRSAATRVAGILVQAMNDYLSYGTGEGHDPVAVRQAAIRLWAMPSLLLRRDDGGTSRGQRERGQQRRRDRCQAVGQGEDFGWMQLARRRCRQA